MNNHTNTLAGVDGTNSLSLRQIMYLVYIFPRVDKILSHDVCVLKDEMVLLVEWRGV